VRPLLDTTYAAPFRGNEAVADRVRRAEQVLISAVVAGELPFGIAAARLARRLASALREIWPA